MTDPTLRSTRDPKASSEMTLAIQNDQVGRVDARYMVAFQRAYNDEKAQMLRYMAKRMQEHANKFNTQKVA